MKRNRTNFKTTASVCKDKEEPKPVTLHEAVRFSSDEYIDWLMSQKND